jgi:SAM-dependent methyltransferase
MFGSLGIRRYAIRGGVEGRERLRLVSEVMGDSTRALLAEAQIPAGAACLDIGCGGGDVTFDLARAVGPQGRVVGVDIDEIELDLARREAQTLGLANVAFESQDVTAWEPEGMFDVVYCRFLLTHLAEPAALVSTVRRHLRPGGVFIVEDIDFRGHFAEPACPALARSVELYARVVQRRGADPNIGPRLPGLLREAGFDPIGLKLFHPAAFEGGIKSLICVTLEKISDAILQDGLATAEELSRTIEQLNTFARNPQTILGGPRVFQTWGRC